MPKDNKQPSRKDEKKKKKKKKSLLESIRSTFAKTSPGGFLIEKSRERIDRVLKNLK